MKLLSTMKLVCSTSMILAFGMCSSTLAQSTSSVGTLLRYDFNNAAPWPVTSQKPDQPSVAYGKFGTVDVSGSAERSGGLALIMDCGAQPGWKYGKAGYVGPSETDDKEPLASHPWRAQIASGPLAVQNSEENLGKLTLSFSLSASRALVYGSSMRKVQLPTDSPRGGLLTQASVLKVTANGTTTSPVLRGAWITERILGQDIPPPPPVGAVEPDIRGAVTIRQQLEKHRADPSCASCHSKMDPPGFALDNFDIFGGWRDNYRAIMPGKEPAVGFGKNGAPFEFHNGLPVDATGEFPDGRTFANVRDFKRLLLGADKQERQIACNLAQQLIIYATGAPVGFSDRTEVERILDRARTSEYGVRDILHEIVQSEMFQNK